jgi:pimeloyl-ACP methyl ester carboxylesterase
MNLPLSPSALRPPAPLVLTGARPATEPVLFLPPFMADARAFQAQVAALSAHRPVSVASLACGETIGDLAQAVLAAAPPRFALVGAGLGGIVALEIARAAPGRAARLALIACDPGADAPALSAAREARLVLARAGRLRDAMRAEITPDALAPGPYVWPVLASVMEMAQSLGPQVFVRQTRALQRRGDRTRILRSLAVPTLILGGEHDTIVRPERIEALDGVTPRVQARIIDTAGHLPTLEAPEAVTAALADWLGWPLLLT